PLRNCRARHFPLRRPFLSTHPPPTLPYPLSLHDALPIWDMRTAMHQLAFPGEDISDRPPPSASVPAFLRLLDERPPSGRYRAAEDRKSTRLNSSHRTISYAVFCLKKQNCARERRLGSGEK